MADHGLQHQERKVATVLFADIADSTSLGERLDIEPLGQVMGAFQRAVQTAVEQCDGTADFVGDAVVAIFGAPRATENHQGRALAAADLILDAVAELNHRLLPRLGVSLRVRIGVNTGEVLVDPNLDLRLGALAGDTFNVAARLEQAAAVGEIWVGERTISAVTGREVVDLGRIEIGGRAQPVRAFRVGPAGSGPEPSSLPRRLVGRAPEIAVLTEALEEVRSTGAARIVTVIGEAGIGKSALIDAFVSRVSGPTGVQVAASACRAFGSAGAVAPLARLLESALDAPLDRALIADLLGPGADREVDTLVRAFGTEEAHGLEAEAPGRAARDLATAWRLAVARLSEDELWVFTVEDLHWAEPEALDLLRASPSTGKGVLLVVTARPELREQNQWPIEPGSGELIQLGALDLHSTGELAVQVAPDIERTPAFATALHRMTEGNPFFVVELVRSVSERGDIDGVALLEASSLGIPDTVQGVLADRIDRLEPQGKRVLQAASVIGREFFPDGIAALLGVEAPAVDRTIQQLIDRRMVEVAPDHVAPYRFVHALTRDVAYASMPRRELHGLHETAADWLEANPAAYEGDTAAMIAFHLGHASNSLKADWEATADRVASIQRRWVDWTIRAARRATEATGFTEAKRLAQIAVDEATDVHQLVDAMQCLGDAHFYSYEGDDAWETLTAAADRAYELGDRTPSEVAALYIRALESPVRWAGGMRRPPAPAELQARIERARALLPSGDSVEQVRLLTVIGFWPYATVGHPDTTLIAEGEARAAAEAAAEIAPRLGRIDLESAALDGLSSTHIFRGDYAAADSVMRRRCELYEALVDPWERGDLCAMAGWVAFHQARYTEAIEWTTRGVEDFGDDYPSIGLHCRNWRGLARLRRGEWACLLEDLSVVEAASSGGLPVPYATPLVAAGALVRHLQGQNDESDRLLELLATAEWSDDTRDGEPPLARWAEYVAPILARRGEIGRAIDLIDRTSFRRASRMGQLLLARCLVTIEGADWKEADRLIESCNRQAAELGTPVVLTGSRIVEGARAFAQGAWDEALAAFREAGRLAESQADAWLAAFANLGVAETAIHLGDIDRARRGHHAAVETFGALGSVRELQRARRLSIQP